MVNQVIFTPQGAIAGHVENGIYFTIKDPEKHLFKLYNGYGISEEILEKLKELKVHLIQIKEKRTGKTFNIKLTQYLVSQRRYSFNGDVQRFIPLSSCNKNSDLSNFIGGIS